MTYDLVMTAVSERADLLARTLESMLPRLDVAPARLIVHEDVKPGSSPGEIAAFLRALEARGSIGGYQHLLTDPARGMGLATLALLRAASTPIVFYTPEDFDFVRDVPAARALGLMEGHDVHHLAFGKRATPAAKHPGESDEWRKVEKSIGGQLLTIAQYWRSQGSFWRVARILPFFERLTTDPEPDRWAMVKVNRWMNEAFLGDPHGSDQEARHERLRTYLWGGIGERAFISHTGADRRSEIQSIAHYGGGRTGPC